MGPSDFTNNIGVGPTDAKSRNKIGISGTGVKIGISRTDVSFNLDYIYILEETAFLLVMGRVVQADRSCTRGIKQLLFFGDEAPRASGWIMHEAQ